MDPLNTVNPYIKAIHCELYNKDLENRNFNHIKVKKVKKKKKKKVEDQFWLWSYHFTFYVLYYFGDSGSTGINITKQNSQYLQLLFIV